MRRQCRGCGCFPTMPARVGVGLVCDVLPRGLSCDPWCAIRVRSASGQTGFAELMSADTPSPYGGSRGVYTGRRTGDGALTADPEA